MDSIASFLEFIVSLLDEALSVETSLLLLFLTLTWLSSISIGGSFRPDLVGV